MLEVLATSGLYDAVLNDGTVVDFRSWMISKGFLNPSDSGVGSWWKEIQREFRDGVKFITHKPLKALPFLVGAGALGAFGGGAQAAIKAAVSNIGGKAASLIKSKKWTTLNRLVRTSLQATGVIPTSEMLQAATQQLVDQTVWGGYTNGEPVQIDPGNIEWPREPNTGNFSMQELEQYLPWIVAGGLALILVLKK